MPPPPPPPPLPPLPPPTKPVSKFMPALVYAAETIFLDIRVHKAVKADKAVEADTRAKGGGAIGAATETGGTRVEFSYTVWRWISGERTLLAVQRRDYFIVPPSFNDVSYLEKSGIALYKVLTPLLTDYNRIARKFVIGTNFSVFYFTLKTKLQEWISKNTFDNQRMAVVWRQLAATLYGNKRTRRRNEFSFRILNFNKNC